MKKLLYLLFSITGVINSNAQRNDFIQKSAQLSGLPGNLKSAVSFSTIHSFTGQIGQYELDDHYSGFGKIYAAYEGFSLPVLFTQKGLIFLQEQQSSLSHKEEEKLEKSGLREEEIEHRMHIEKQTVSMEWEGANESPEILLLDKTADYHTYGLLAEKAAGYKRILYKNLYAGIDVLYTLSTDLKRGFEYSLIIHPGADISVVRMKYGGDCKKPYVKNNGSLIVNTKIDQLIQSDLTSFTCTGKSAEEIISLQQNETVISTKFDVNGMEVYFKLLGTYDHTKMLVIDPFVSSASSLAGVNAGKAKDVDFDYAGNIYVSGGGSQGTTNQLAKYNAAGVLQWTFDGTVANPVWSFGPYFGGWVVDKPTGNVYIGQGFNYTTGFRIIRLTTNGLYDNFITNGNPSFSENWKMYWNCNSGVPQIIIAGGGINSDINLGLCSPPSVTVSASNLTGISGIAFQDMADMIIDPVTNSMYTVYASGSVATLNNAVYKHNQPYSPGTIQWSTQSGFPVLQEAANRPYLGPPLQDNSANLLSVNSAYLFYWDGKNLKAFDKLTGSMAGTPLTIAANTVKMQGGIVADACNNIFVGSANGVIKVYNFNGAVFDDAAAPDLAIAGYTANAVYDLVYNETQKLIYASGDGFVASLDVAGYCLTTAYTLTTAVNCVTSSVTATVSPAPPAGSTVNYILYNGTTQLATNTTGIFSGLLANINYSITATINQACSGTQTSTSFVLPGPTVAISQTNSLCGSNTGSVTATGSVSTPPYTYSIDGATFLPVGNFTGLSSGVYTITVKDSNGCKSMNTVTLLNINGPTVAFTSTDATCGNSSGSITAIASGGAPPYQYSINGVIYQNSNFFTALAAGTYTLTVKDTTGCTNAVSINILSASAIQVSAVPATASCGNNNGSITVFATGGAAPLQYSINGNTYQSGNSFVSLTPGAYTVSVKDATGCIKTTAVTVGNSSAPTVTATTTAAACNNANGSIIATGTGGVAPLQYSINGNPFQLSNVFTGLTAGNWIVTVMDALNCKNTTSVTISSTGGPSVSATSTSTSCSSNTGTVTVTAVATSPQYSINGGVSYQGGNVFSGLASGAYVVLVKDINGCLGAATVVVGNIAGPLLTSVSVPTSCSSNTGSITISGTGGTAPLQFSINGTAYQADSVFTGLGTGTYTVYVKDANGCVNSKTAVVANASGLTLSVSATNTTCTANNGSITATASGGIGSLQYSINGTAYQTSNVFNGIALGTYTIYVKDSNNCIVTKQITINTSFSIPVLTVTTPLNSTCTAGANGVIIASCTGGIAPLRYSISGTVFQSSGTFLGVAAGTYTVTVKDTLGCSATQVVTITNSISGSAPTALTVRTSYFPCNGDVTGKISNFKPTPAVGGGVTYTYSLDFGAYTTGTSFTGVTPGLHTVTAKNNNGCTITILVNLAASNSSTASSVVTGTACNASTGSIALTGIGVNTPFHASISGIGGPWITFDPSTTFAGLAAGQYTIILADDASFDIGPPIIPGGCLTTLNFVVPSTGGPSISSTKINGTCGLNNGSITLTGTGGTGSLMYSLNGGAYQADNVFQDLGPGNYIFEVIDDLGCTNIRFDTLINPGGPAIAVSSTTTSCRLNNASITVSASGTLAPYQYSIDGFSFQPGNTFNNVAAGNYTAYAKDANGCYSTSFVTITASALPVVTAYTIPSTCSNSNGSIVAGGASGSSPYLYSIDSVTFQSSSIFTGLAADFYTVYIKDNRGCISSTSIAVGNSGAPTFTTVLTGASCGNPIGVITVTATGGSIPYQYSLDGTSFQLSNVLSNLITGSYTVTVKDANGCLANKPVLITNANGPQTLTATVTNASCGLNNGSVTLVATGGTPALQYSINGTVYQVSAVFSGLAPNNYTVYVKDSKGCIKTLPVSLINLAGPAVTASSSAATCLTADGTITAVATGGTGAITYSKNGVAFQASNIFTGLTAGTYTITAKDTKGCTSATILTVNALATITASKSHTNANCGNINGTITVTGHTGTAPYQYALNAAPYQIGNQFTSLAPGNYTVSVKDFNGCTVNVLDTIVNLPGPTVTASAQPACGIPGSVIATGNGGSGTLLYSIDATNYNDSGLFNNLADGLYTVTVKDTNNCFNTNTVNVVSYSTNPRTWLGFNTNWHDSVNWCGGVPTLSNNVLIPSGRSNYPLITNGIAYCKNITIQSGAAVTVYNMLQISGDINNQGILNALAGTIELNGNAVQSISGSYFYLHTINHLRISNTHTGGVVVSAVPGDTLKISRKLSFGYDSALLTTGNQITLLSSDTATAAIGIIRENADGSPMASINGEIIVERFYPKKRAWRLIAAPLKADAVAPSINSAWQEGANPPSVTGVGNPNPHPYYGTHITGPWNSNTAYSALVTSSGFDQSPQNNSSLKFYSGTSNTFTPVTNTYTTKVTDHQGYLLFVRGDRSYNISTTTNFTTPTNALLRERGHVNTGKIQVPADTGFQVIGNPYASAIKFGDSMFNENAAIMKNAGYWLWDPLRGSAKASPSNIGGLVPIVYMGNGNYVSTYNPGISVAGLDSAHSFEIDGTIQSGAAFMIENKATATGNFIMHENSKIDSSNNHLFRPVNGNTPFLLTTVFRTDANNKPVYWADAAMVLFDNDFQNEYAISEDMNKIFSTCENICISKDNQPVAIEKRKNFVAGDSVLININGFKAGNYKFEIIFHDFASNGLTAYFEDKYTGLLTPLSLTGNTLIDIAITTDPASFATGRFRIIFAAIAVLPVTVTHFTGWLQHQKVSLQWTVENQQHISRFEIEKSADSRTFTQLAAVPANSNPTYPDSYHLLDQYPASGDNFYRLKIFDQSGGFTYSQTILINISSGKGSLKIYPNPVTNNKIQLLISNMKQGVYSWNLYNSGAQLIGKNVFNYKGGTYIYPLISDVNLPAGIYELNITDPVSSTTSLRVTVK